MSISPMPKAITAFLSDLKLLGVVPQEYDGLRYALLAARSNQRWWLVPLQSRAAAATGLEMFKPVSRTARWAKVFTRWIAHLGLLGTLSRYLIMLSNLPTPRAWFPEGTAHCAYFTGTDGPHRKTAIQFMDSGGAILGFAKLSREDHVRRFIRNEAKMLAEVAALRLKTVEIPRVIHFADPDGLSLLTTDSLKSGASETALVIQASHRAFLEELRQKTARMGAYATLGELGDSVALLRGAVEADHVGLLDRALEILQPSAETIEVGLAHGDFTPWNSFMQDGALYVFDWEYAHRNYPVGFDYVHFTLSTIPPDVQRDAAERLVEDLARLFFAGDRDAARRALLLSLALHAAFYLRRQLEAGAPTSDWQAAAGRFALIRTVIEMAPRGGAGVTGAPG